MKTQRQPRNRSSHSRLSGYGNWRHHPILIGIRLLFAKRGRTGKTVETLLEDWESLTPPGLDSVARSLGITSGKPRGRSR